MKWVLVAVAFLLGAGITWLLTVRRVRVTVPAVVDAAGDPNDGGSGMGSDAKHVEGVADDPDREAGAGPVEDDLEDASRFGGERTSSTVSPRVGWDDDAEDIDALLTEEEKSGERESGGQPWDEKPLDEKPLDEQTQAKRTSGERESDEQKPDGV